ncbi:MAG: hypothetical protein RLZ56_227 [Bacteroidota bacterium]|jgi:hypothetical protein
MRKYLFGILLLFVFLQPVTAKDLAYHSVPCFTHNGHASFSESIPPSPQNQLDELVIDADDEDEISASENNHVIRDLIFENQTQAPIVLLNSIANGQRCETAPYRQAKQPLYILWRVFRI